MLEKAFGFKGLMRDLAPLEAAARKAGLFPFRPHQALALNEWARGRDLLLVWPTGSGKSLCYQLPALVQPGLTVVVSPLIALMEDQVAKARAFGWPATCIHSALSRDEKEVRLKKVREGQVKLLYVTPERFRQPAFCEVMKGLKVSLLAVDEAHCISQWGHDFRPDYSRLREVREALGRPQTMALTATATVQVQKDILTQLDIPDAVKLWEGVERPNLYLAAEEVDGLDEKIKRLSEWIHGVSGAKIIYFTLISTLEKVAARLKEPLAIYHGEMESSARHRVQKDFVAGKVNLLLATPAFGLGVDKPDIRGILHFEVPGSIEAYYQEVGRAGRDAQRADCLLLYSQDDIETQMRFIDSLTPEPDYTRSVYDLLVRWQDRLKSLTLDDLRAQLSFKNKSDLRLETALNQLDRLEVIHWSHRRLDKLEFLRELEPEDLNAEQWNRRRRGLQEKLLHLVQWFRADECRKRGIYRYFGRPVDTDCGFCDHCLGGETAK